MKRLSLILFLFVGLYMVSIAQVREEKLNMILGVNNAVIMQIPDADKSFVEKEWREFMKKYGDVDKVKKTSQWLIQSANLVNYEDIGRVNIYAEAMDKTVPTELALWIQIDTEFLNSTDHPNAYQAALNFMDDFALKVRIDLLNIELEQHEKVLEKYQSNLSRLESENAKYVSTIDQAHKDIGVAEDNIVKNQRDQESTTTELDGLKGDPASEKEVSKLEKKKRNLEKDYLAFINTIARNNDRIGLADSNIEKNAADQETLKAEIEEQKLVVKEVRDRLTAERAAKGE